MFTKFLIPLLLALYACSALAIISQDDFTDIGRILVLNSTDWTKTSPADKVGCLSSHGKFVQDASKDSCGVFTRLKDYPYTLSSPVGNCTFDDETQEKNTDSIYGAGDHAWNCNETWKSTINDELYTLNGFPYVFLCFGDIACYYDAKRMPKAGEALSLWQFRWGSDQIDITPGHIMLQLLWEKIGDLPKREGDSEIVGAKSGEEVQIALKGRESRVL